MKLFLPFVILLLFLFSENSFGQDTTTSIIKSWTILKSQLQKRTDIVINLTNVLTKSNKVDKKELAKSKIFATDIFKYLDTLKQFDSLSIAVAMKKNSSLTQSLTKTFVSFENDTKFNKRNDVMTLIAQLEGTENRISLARKEYNEICKTFNRLDLQFLVNEDTKAIQVQF